MAKIYRARIYNVKIKLGKNVLRYAVICYRFDEHAQIDLPAMLDYVMKVTGQDKLFYVGHSQGTVMGFAGFTSNQSLAQHITAFFALAPVSTVKYIKGLFAFIAEKIDVNRIILVFHLLCKLNPIQHSLLWSS